MHASARRIEVARAAGVSEATVSRSLNDSSLISIETREKVKQIAQQLGYIPSRQAALFSKSKTCRLGFVVPSYKMFPTFSRSYFPALLDGAVLGAQQHGFYVTIILDHHENPADLVTLVKSREIDGLIIAVPGILQNRIADLLNNKIPFVIVNDYREKCSSVDSKAGPGIKTALEYCKSLGHTNIGFITGDKRYHNATDRESAFVKYCIELDIKFTITEGNFSRTSGYRGAGKLLCSNEKITCIMTSADRQAIGVLDYCREHKIQIPDEVSVIGFDNLDPAADVTPALTTVDNRVTETGKEAARLLCEILKGDIQSPVQRWLDTGFEIRQSSAPVKYEKINSKHIY